MSRIACCLAVLMLSSFAFAQEFSADIFDIQKSEAQGKVYFGKDKVRFEPRQKDPRGGGAFIFNLATQTATALMDQQHMYMEIPTQMAQQRTAYRFFRPVDVENACKDWLAQSWNKGGTCHKVGSDTVNGRSAIKYEGTNSEGQAGTVWIDSKLHSLLKWQGKNGDGFEFRNIQEGSQPSGLFEIPAGYTKFDMSNMMQRPQ